MKVLLLCLALAAGAEAQLVTITASNTTDSSGNPINGTIFFQPASSTGAPISYRIIGKGQVTAQTVSAPVTNGAFTLQIADTTQTQPANVCYRVWATDSLHRVVLGSQQPSSNSGYNCVQVSPAWCVNGACSFDAYPPNLPAQAIVQTGPQGEIIYSPQIESNTIAATVRCDCRSLPAAAVSTGFRVRRP